MAVKRRAVEVVSITRASEVPLEYKMSYQGVTFSLLSAFLACPMRGRLALARWGTAGKATKTRFGSLWHGLLERAYRETRPAADALAERWLREVGQELRADYGGLIRAADKQMLEMDIATAFELWRAYRVYHAKDWERLAMRRGKTETEFAVPVSLVPNNGRMGPGRMELIIRGKRDGIIPDKSGALWLLEHKTHAQIDDEWFAAHIGIDLQVLLYLWASRAVGEEAIGVQYNVVRTPGLQSKGLTLGAWREKLRADIAERPDHYFHRYEARVLPEQLRAFDADLREMLYDFWRRLQAVPPYKCSVACRTPYPCEYLAACSSGTMAGYTQREHLNPELGYWKETHGERR